MRPSYNSNAGDKINSPPRQSRRTYIPTLKPSGEDQCIRTYEGCLHSILSNKKSSPAVEMKLDTHLSAVPLVLREKIFSDVCAELNISVAEGVARSKRKVTLDEIFEEVPTQSPEQPEQLAASSGEKSGEQTPPQTNSHQKIPLVNRPCPTPNASIVQLSSLEADMMMVPVAIATSDVFRVSREVRLYAVDDDGVTELPDGRLQRTVRSIGGYDITASAMPDASGNAALSLGTHEERTYMSVVRLSMADTDINIGVMTDGIGQTLKTGRKEILGALGVKGCSSKSLARVSESLELLKNLHLSISKGGIKLFDGTLINDLELTSRSVSLRVNPDQAPLFKHYASVPRASMTSRRPVLFWLTCYTIAIARKGAESCSKCTTQGLGEDIVR